MIGAGSVVAKDVPPYTIHVGSHIPKDIPRFTGAEIIEHENKLYGHTLRDYEYIE